jgi:tetratricopeptide (TPR) repeat protein
VRPWWQIAAASGILISLSVLVIRALPRRPYLGVGWLWYVGTLVPVIGLVQVGSQSMADRYTYVPLVGIFIIVAWGIPDLVGGLRHSRTVFSAAAVLFLAGMAASAWQQTKYWQNSISLYEHTLEVTTDNANIHYNLGLALAGESRLLEAAEHFSEAVRIRPDLANARNNLGNAHILMGNIEEAIAQYREALRSEPSHPFALKNLIDALAKLDDNKKAIAELRETLKVVPDNPTLRFKLAGLYRTNGSLDAAIEEYHKLLELQPKSSLAINGLALAYTAKGDYHRALALYEKLLEAEPNSYIPYYNIACLYSLQNKVDESVEWLRKAINKGFNNWTLLKTDKDLENVRRSPKYQRLLDDR